MLAITRRKIIKELLQINKSVTIADLSTRLNVTKETIRRDLNVMERANELIRTHGGAYILDGVQNDLDISTRQILKTAEKELIAEKCDPLILPGDIIYLDSSTTAWFIAKKICQKNLTVVTSSLEIINILKNSPSIHLIVIGGEFSKKNMSFTGAGTIEGMKQHFVDKAFISSRSVNIEFGITDTNDTDAILHRIILEHARETYLIADGSKINRVSFSSVAPLSKLTGIITDIELSDEWKECLKSNNVAYF